MFVVHRAYVCQRYNVCRLLVLILLWIDVSCEVKGMISLLKKSPPVVSGFYKNIDKEVHDLIINPQS